MKATSLLCFALALVACDAPPAAQESAADQPVDLVSDTDGPQIFEAVLECSANGTSFAASQCLVGGAEGLGGELKVRSGGDLKLYSRSELYRPPFTSQGPTRFDVEAPFEISVVNNSKPPFVLRIEIKDGSRTVYQDEISGFSGTLITDAMIENGSQGAHPKPVGKRFNDPAADEAVNAVLGSVFNTLNETSE